MRLHQTRKLMHSEGNHHENEKQPTGWENIFTNHILDKGLMCKYIKTHTTQQQKANQFLKMGRGSECSFLQRRHTHSQLAHENMFSVTNHQGNANPNDNEISTHTSWNGYYQKDKK